MERKLPGRNFRKFGFTSRGCPVCLETSGNADPFTTAKSCRKFKPRKFWLPKCKVPEIYVGSQRHCPQERFFLSDARQSEVDFLHS